MKFISLSQYPGRTGEYYYNNMFKLMNIDAEYTALACTDIKQSIAAAIKQGVRGISISMPYKQQVIPLLDNVGPGVSLYNSCNTIVNNEQGLTGFNCDISGMEHVVKSILRSEKINILGSGAMAHMFTTYLTNMGYNNLNLCSRKSDTWLSRFSASEVIINATGMGTISEESPFAPGQLNPSTRLVIDLAIKPNDLQRQCQDMAIKYISGREFYQHQFMTQFYVYTGQKVEAAQYETLEKQQYESV
jgi:shikimate dehydrogenase